MVAALGSKILESTSKMTIHAVEKSANLLSVIG